MKRRVNYLDLTAAAQSELPFIIEEIINDEEERFIRFFNDAQAITTRLHMLELLPGLGKKTMWHILEERKKMLSSLVRHYRRNHSLRRKVKRVHREVDGE